MPAEADKFVWDAKESAKRILRFAAGKTLDDYRNDEMLKAAVERQFTILGEALGRLRQLNVSPSSASHRPAPRGGIAQPAGACVCRDR